MEVCKEYLSVGRCIYGPPEPPPDSIDVDLAAHYEHIYIHPFDYDPIRVTDLTFDDFLPTLESMNNPKSEVFFIFSIYISFQFPPTQLNSLVSFPVLRKIKIRPF